MSDWRERAWSEDWSKVDPQEAYQFALKLWSNDDAAGAYNVMNEVMRRPDFGKMDARVVKGYTDFWKAIQAKVVGM